ncbi:Uncharacterised protein [Klebsiella pneumoniae]|nr:Uncharacterised protein [Klebsiella pneumoniae]SWJ72986.1 Uncharacterised protein [Klebsiella pneumoniae]VDA23421.1 hypothetical protein BANRA_03337 [Klebsiella pneumoniae]
MFAVTDRTEPARGFRPQSLPTQAGRHGFYVIHPSLSTKLIRQAWRTIALFCVTECFPDDVITNKAELLTPVYLMTTLMPDVPTTTGNLKYTAHGFDTEFSLMFFDEDILHFRRFAKYVAAFWRMASSSSRSAS